MGHYRHAAVLAGCLLLSMVGLACGSDRTKTTATPPASTTTSAAPSNVVTNDEIRKTKPRTPERTVLTWAQAVQYRDVTSARDAYTRRIRANVPAVRLDAAVREIGELLGKPHVVNTLMRGQLALCRASLISYGPRGQVSQQRTTFRLLREDGDWKLDDVRLLLDTAAALRRLRG